LTLRVSLDALAQFAGGIQRKRGRVKAQ